MKKFVSGLVLGATIATTTLIVMASTGLSSAKIDENISLIVNGTEVETEIINAVKEGQVNAKNYVSARDLAEALGAEVLWLPETNEIIVTDKTYSPNTSVEHNDVNVTNNDANNNGTTNNGTTNNGATNNYATNNDANNNDATNNDTTNNDVGDDVWIGLGDLSEKYDVRVVGYLDTDSFAISKDGHEIYENTETVAVSQGLLMETDSGLMFNEAKFLEFYTTDTSTYVDTNVIDGEIWIGLGDLSEKYNVSVMGNLDNGEFAIVDNLTNETIYKDTVANAVNDGFLLKSDSALLFNESKFLEYYYAE